MRKKAIRTGKKTQRKKKRKIEANNGGRGTTEGRKYGSRVQG